MSPDEILALPITSPVTEDEMTVRQFLRQMLMLALIDDADWADDFRQYKTELIKLLIQHKQIEGRWDGPVWRIQWEYNRFDYNALMLILTGAL